MRGICALSKMEAELQDSHIYPKFAIRYLRDTSNNGLLRSYKNVNMASQDGLKQYLLSRESEQRFSKAETWFANNFFHPVTTGRQQLFPYDNHLYYFIISLLWRGLLVQLTDKTIIDEPYYHLLEACEKQWRSFLLSGYIPTNYRSAFMMIVPPKMLQIAELPFSQYYLLRNLDSTIVTNDRGIIYMYMKLPRFLFWAPIVSPYFSVPNSIDLLGGHFDSLNVPEDPIILDFLKNRITQINNLKSNLSENQHDVTMKRIRKDLDGFLSSEAGMLMTGEE